MNRTHVASVLAGLVAVLLVAANACAMYDPVTGGFLCRDAGLDGLTVPPRVGQCGVSGQYRDGMHLRQYVRSNPARFVDPTGLYGLDIHFYLTYYLARECGFSQYGSGMSDAGNLFTEAYVLAWADQYTDVNSQTEPWHNAGRFHFVTTPIPNWPDTTRSNSDEVNAIVDKGIANNDLLQAGAGLHAYQDSWSHAGYGSQFGHVSAGHKPDWPFDRLDTAMVMARFTFDKMNRFMQRRHCRPCAVTFDEIESQIRAIIMSANSTDESARVAVWQTQIPGLGYADGGDSDAWAPAFVTAVDTVRPR